LVGAVEGRGRGSGGGSAYPEKIAEIKIPAFQRKIIVELIANEQLSSHGGFACGSRGGNPESAQIAADFRIAVLGAAFADIAPDVPLR
jgi:hypothetical protein